MSNPPASQSYHKPTLHELGSLSDPTNRLSPKASDDPRTARLRAWAHEHDYVVPGQDGTISMAPGNVFGNVGGGALRLPRMGETERPLDERLGLVKPKDGEKGVCEGGRTGEKEEYLHVEGKGEGEGVGQEEERKKKRGSFSKFFRRGSAQREGSVEEDAVR
ncbi:hypothetical protein MMC15_006489 [Xylographa vitiligo]|nr:hypothetical protein [Xylographa vitiligo]